MSLGRAGVGNCQDQDWAWPALPSGIHPNNFCCCWTCIHRHRSFLDFSHRSKRSKWQKYAVDSLALYCQNWLHYWNHISIFVHCLYIFCHFHLWSFGFLYSLQQYWFGTAHCLNLRNRYFYGEKAPPHVHWHSYIHLFRPYVLMCIHAHACTQTFWTNKR